MSTLTKHAVRNAAATALYVFALGWFMQHAGDWFGSAPNVLGGAIMLLLFIISALVTGGLVLWEPATLFLSGKKSEAGRQLFETGVSLVVILAIILVVLALY